MKIARNAYYIPEIGVLRQRSKIQNSFISLLAHQKKAPGHTAECFLFPPFKFMLDSVTIACVAHGAVMLLQVPEHIFNDHHKKRIMHPVFCLHIMDRAMQQYENNSSYPDPPPLDSIVKQ
jgi:hypothetical protein